MSYQYEAEIEELRAEAVFERHRQNLLARAPDCRDPEHPGCALCWEEDDEEVVDEEENDE